jgi:hypothetical protein
VDSPLARLLYLVEWRLGHLEDMPSAHRVGLCIESPGVSGHNFEAWQHGRTPVAMIA